MKDETARREIESLDYYLQNHTNDYSEESHTAMMMAIKALEQEDVLEKIRTEIKEWYWQADKQALAKDPCIVDAMVDLFIRTIDRYKAESEDKK